MSRKNIEEFTKIVLKANDVLPVDFDEGWMASSECLYQYIGPIQGITDEERSEYIRNFIARNYDNLGHRMISAIWKAGGGGEDEIYEYLSEFDPNV